MDRRGFLGTITAATLLRSKFAWTSRDQKDNHRDDRKIEKIGLQLYTVRSAMKNDFEGTLAKVAGIGYQEVEFAGYFNHSPHDVRKILDANGLNAPSAHVDYEVLGEKWPGTLDASRIMGHTYIVCPSIPDNLHRPDGWKRAAEIFNQAAEASHKAGIQFAFHNHEVEFKKFDGKIPYDIVLAETDPNLVKMEMDLFWTVKGGADPLNYFNRYPGRFPLVHVKGMDKNGKMSEVNGNGAIDWKRIFAQSANAGIKHYFVEHDDPNSPFDSIRNSYTYLRDLRF
jgi:sugar phosphate isomerase/epimerase